MQTEDARGASPENLDTLLSSMRQSYHVLHCAGSQYGQLRAWDKVKTFPYRQCDGNSDSVKP